LVGKSIAWLSAASYVERGPTPENDVNYPYWLAKCLGDLRAKAIHCTVARCGDPKKVAVWLRDGRTKVLE
jgi:hypothetical protein